jgi:hypothetical protein
VAVVDSKGPPVQLWWWSWWLIWLVFMGVYVGFRGRLHGGCGVMVVAHGGFCDGRFELGCK